MAIKPLDTIRSTVPLTGPDVFDEARIHDLPVGSLGAVLEVWQKGAAFEVEFLVDDPAGFRSVMLTVERENIEAVG